VGITCRRTERQWSARLMSDSDSSFNINVTPLSSGLWPFTPAYLFTQHSNTHSHQPPRSPRAAGSEPTHLTVSSTTTCIISATVSAASAADRDVTTATHVTHKQLTQRRHRQHTKDSTGTKCYTDTSSTRVSHNDLRCV